MEIRLLSHQSVSNIVYHHAALCDCMHMLKLFFCSVRQTTMPVSDGLASSLNNVHQHARGLAHLRCSCARHLRSLLACFELESCTQPQGIAIRPESAGVSRRLRNVAVLGPHGLHSNAPLSAIRLWSYFVGIDESNRVSAFRICHLRRAECQAVSRCCFRLQPGLNCRVASELDAAATFTSLKCIRSCWSWQKLGFVVRSLPPRMRFVVEGTHLEVPAFHELVMVVQMEA